MEELNKKLAEWAGFRYVENMLGLALIYDLPDKSKEVALPNFTNSLDACFKWLVPKLFEESFAVIITQDLARACANVRPLQFGKQFEAVDNHNPALALCLAIEKLIDLGVVLNEKAH